MNSGDTAWVLASAALVLFMTPGLAFFYGGMVRAKNVLGMLMQNFFCMGLISVLWVLVVFSLAFGDDHGGVIGGINFVGLAGLARAGASVPGYAGALALSVPPLAFVTFQMMFAIITPALITGATADRLRFRGFAVFVGLWAVLVYAPVAHWVFSPNGWLAQRGALDFAGGTVVHINAGVAALAVVIVIGRRHGWPGDAMPPHSLPLTLLGTGILWFGWFGFNAGSALAANGVAAQALINTHVAAAAAMIGWLIAERFKDHHATTLGAASGAVAGLVAITPCAGYVNAAAAVAIGLIAGVVCFLAIAAQIPFPLRRRARRHRCPSGRRHRRVAPGRRVRHPFGQHPRGKRPVVGRRRPPTGPTGSGRGGDDHLLVRRVPRIGEAGRRDRRVAVDTRMTKPKGLTLHNMPRRPTTSVNSARWGGSDEVGHRDRQAVQARRGQGRPGCGRLARPHGVRDPGLRPPAGTHRGVPGSGVPGRLRAQGQGGSSGGR